MSRIRGDEMGWFSGRGSGVRIDDEDFVDGTTLPQKTVATSRQFFGRGDWGAASQNYKECFEIFVKTWRIFFRKVFNYLLEYFFRNIFLKYFP